MVGLSVFNVPRIETAWRTGPAPMAIMLITFVGTLLMPLLYAVFLGVFLHILLYAFRSAGSLRVEQVGPLKLLHVIGEENVFLGQPEFGAALREAAAVAEKWSAQDSEAVQ